MRHRTAWFIWVFLLLSALFLIAVACTPVPDKPAGAETRMITNCYGGLTRMAVMDIDRMNRHRDTLHLAGDIASSCVLYLGVAKSCYADTTVFYFHNTSRLSDGSDVDSRALFKLYLPAKLYAELTRRGTWDEYGAGNYVKMSGREVATLDDRSRVCH